MKLTDALGNVYTFPANFRVNGFNWKKKTRITEVAFADGGDETGDNKQSTRLIEIEGVLADNATYFTTQNTLNSWLIKKDMKLCINSGTYINVKTIGGASYSFFDGAYGRVSKVKFSCICTDPYFYSDTLTVVSTLITTIPQTITLVNSSLFSILPIYTITNIANNPSVIIENTTDGGNFFSYTDAAFLAGDVLIVNTLDGTVKKNGINVILNFLGSFPRIIAGTQILLVNSASATLDISYRNAEL